jgi:hypothetical protein
MSDISVGGAAAVALLVVTVALLIHPFQVRLVKLLEGYVGRNHPLYRYGMARHVRRVHGLRAQRAPMLRADGGTIGYLRARQRLEGLAEKLREYPESEDRLLPTRLGNALRDAEDRAGERYGIAAVSFFPYLYATMPADVTAQVSDARNEMDVAAMLCSAFVVLSSVTLVAFGDDQWWLTVPVVLYALAWLSYLATVTSAKAYGRQLCRAVDLYRFTVLDALSLRRPVNRADERRLFKQLHDLIDPQSNEKPILYRHRSLL